MPEFLDQQPDPRGTLAGVRLGPVGVFTVSGTPQVVRRTTSAVRRSPGDLIKVCVQLHGRATVQQDSHEVALDPGELAVHLLVGGVVLIRPVHGDEQHAVVPAFESELLVLRELHGLLLGTRRRRTRGRGGGFSSS